jgi:predicted transcriptional regulator
MARVYPQPGTNADRILQFIRDNPDTSISNITTKLNMNPSPTRDLLQALEAKGLIKDEKNGQGHHQYRVKGPSW